MVGELPGQRGVAPDEVFDAATQVDAAVRIGPIRHTRLRPLVPIRADAARHIWMPDTALPVVDEVAGEERGLQGSRESQRRFESQPRGPELSADRRSEERR